jgi:hypothetical protein
MRWPSVAQVCLILTPSILAAWPNVASQFPPDKNPQYFPVGVLSKNSDSSDFRARWYAIYLRTMSEPSLYLASHDSAVVVYRFLWLRTFHHPIVVRLSVRSNGSGALTVLQTSGSGGFRTGTVTVNRTVEVSTQQVQGFLQLLQKLDFWSLPTEGGPPGLDGAEWILEGVEHGKYHIVVRWSPEKGDFRKACFRLLSLSGLRVDPKEVY